MWSFQGRRVNIALGVACIVVLASCRSSDSSFLKPSITGRVLDPLNQPVAGVHVRQGDRLLGITDENGTFRIRPSAPAGRLAVSFSKAKFMSTTRIFNTRKPSHNGNTIVIWPRAAARRLSASRGGRLEFAGGAIMFPPDAFVDATGRPVVGEVDVSMSVLDLFDPRQVASAPGDFTARMRDGSIRNLETFGLFELVFADTAGGSVELARDRSARVELNASRLRPAPGAAISVGSFSFDKRSGRWSEQAFFEVQEATLVTTVSASGWWNADWPIDTTCLKVRVLGCHVCEQTAPAPVMNATVKASGNPNSYTGASYQDNTDSAGEVCLPVKQGPALVDIKVTYGGHDHDLLEVATSPLSLDPANCSGCPLVTATHFVDSPFSNDPLTPYDSIRWCRSQHWNGSPFINAWLKDAAHIDFTSSGLVLTLNNKDASGSNCVATGSADDPSANCRGASYASGEYKTNCFYGHGTYSATITPPPYSATNLNDGLVIGFFTFTNDDLSRPDDDGTIAENNATPPWDEIDIEVLGRHPISSDCDTSSPCDPQASLDPNTHNCLNTDLVVQTNFIGKGVGFNLNEQRFCLPYGTYTYSFTWTNTSITWTATDSNGTKVLRTTPRSSASTWPTQPGRVYMNLWGNSLSGSSGVWAGTFSYSSPVSAAFTDVSVP